MIMLNNMLDSDRKRMNDNRSPSGLAVFMVIIIFLLIFIPATSVLIREKLDKKAQEATPKKKVVIRVYSEDSNELIMEFNGFAKEIK